MRINKILVPVDFSEPSKRAVSYGISLALQFGSEVVLTHIAPFDRTAYETAKARLLELIVPDIRQHLDFEIVVKAGDVREELLGIVRDKDIDLVVMGSHGRGYLERMMLGSVTERMLRKLDVPVLTVSHLDSEHIINNPTIVPMKRILYACDLTDDSGSGLKFAMRLAREADARLIVTHVIDPMGNGFLNEQAVGYMPEYIATVRAQSEDYLDRLVTQKSDGSVPITTVLGEGTPWSVINEVAAQCKADLIIINLHGRGTLERMLLGSTAERVIRTATVPVLALPPAAVNAARWVAA